MKYLQTLFFIFLLAIPFKYASSQTNFRNKELFQFIHSTINDYKIGSGFSFVVFSKVKNNINNIQIASSNSYSKYLLDSLFSLSIIPNYFTKLKKGTYCLPIIQNAAKGDDELIWINNSFSNIIGFDWPRFKLPENCFLLNPIVLNLTALVR